MQHAPPARVLEALFDLTPTEAKVASLLVEGRSVVDIARANKVSANTIRIQLKSVFAKTGARRQAELVSLLAITTPGRE
jgi:DNA-binding CsgD family transcriptional regulator